MVVSAAKLEANRRNAHKSTGPWTEDGKNRSKMNALKHGCRAETLVLPEEDPQELEARRAAWTASLGPPCELEQRAVDDAVVYSWRQDRARRAEVARADVRMADGGEAERAATENEVADLGRRLFKDRLGPVAFYPLVADDPAMMCTRAASTSYPPRQDDEDPDLPATLVRRLRESLAGCEWMLGELARLQSVLDKGQPWISAEKLKAVRLLGRQPFDAIDDGDVALIFLASLRLKPEQAEWAWEILSEMDARNQQRFRSNAADRELESLMPADTPAARHALGDLIQRETERLHAKAETHHRRERVKAARAGDLLGFDETPEGERLRRFEITSGRGYNHAIDTFMKLRRAEAIGQLSIGPSPDVSTPLSDDPWSVANEMAVAIAETDAPNQPALDSDVDLSWGLEYPSNEPRGDRWENTTNEATDGPSSVVTSPLLGGTYGPLENVTNEPNDRPASVISCALPEGAPPREDVTVEAIAVRENLTNEPTGSSSLIVVNRLLEGGFAESPVAGAGTNEATVGQLSVVDCPSLGDRCEPLQNESHEDAVKRIRRTREEHVRKLNEQARKEAEQAMASRRARLHEQRKSGEKPQNRLTGQARRGAASRKNEAAGLNADRLSNLVEAALGQHGNAHRNAYPPPD
jgi:hypothetical protein